MNRNQAFRIIGEYFESWIKKDTEIFNKVIHDAAIIRECTGAVMEGKNELVNWFTQWNNSDNKVDCWEIKEIGFDEASEAAFVEWRFKCLYDAQEYEWDGASIVYFKDSLIIELNEYKMKQNKFFPYRSVKNKESAREYKDGLDGR
ncbi:nuclear transport factor 2 family protein [Paenibacillus sp. Aloe-11]|uniref:nuclear transport factor 2 family protein n=1 Tax=Paenibacillus sp. Aloe-11 TaxID=1050222 RepID=UPI0005C4A5D0|nr:nuclear transport factor 2 family protein [Paenibacillus sp. Aloe-11]